MILEKRIALITGAGKGIGLAISNGLANMGYQTVLVSRSADDLQNAAEEIIRSGGLAPLTLNLDITHSDTLREAVSGILNKYGRIDVLVNNAGIYIDGTLELTEEELKSMIETNLVAQFNLTKAVVPVMEKQQSGYIFNVVSRAGKVGFAGSGGYSASKFGMLGLNESLYRELVPKGIRVTALCPGWVNTRMAFEAGTPLQEMEMIQPEDLFETVKWLLSLSSGACVKEVVIEAPLSHA
jgi:NAD(P)-dependent dehydrogenase (short-subunit alcohol dehydrogenase family)